MKILQASQQSLIQIVSVNEELEILEKTFTVETIPIADIADSVTRESREQVEGFGNLEQGILSNGMRNPIIVTRNYEEAYEHAAVNVEKAFVSPYDPSKPFLCLFGNQRLAIAIRNGFEAISAIVVSTPFWAITLHHKLA